MKDPTTIATQCAAILEHLQGGRTVNPQEALSLFNCFRLGARIYDLRKQGHKITMRLVDPGSGNCYAEYRLIEQDVEAAPASPARGRPAGWLFDNSPDAARM